MIFFLFFLPYLIGSCISRHETPSIHLFLSISTCGSTSYLVSVDFNHVVFWRHILGVPSTLPCSAVFAILFSSIRSTCPRHLCCLSCTFRTDVSDKLRAILMCSFIILSMMWMPRINAAISNTKLPFFSFL